MAYFSEAWGVDVRDQIAAEFTSLDGTVDDNLAGLHEVRARLAEKSDSKALPSSTAGPAEVQAALEAEGWRILPRGRSRPAA
jgi:hypothetical protein